MFGARLDRYAEGETMLARAVLAALRPGMQCLADRQFFGHALWQAAVATGADLLWRGGVVLRSKTPELVRQEVWGLLLAHFAVRGLMYEAALKADEDPDRLSFSHAARGPPQAAAVRRAFPLGPGTPCMTPCWTKSSKSAR